MALDETEEESKKVSRRQLLGIVAGAVVAGGAAGAGVVELTLPSKPAVTIPTFEMHSSKGGTVTEMTAIPESKGFIVYDPSLCTGDLACMKICSAYKNGGVVSPRLARIQVASDPFDGSVHNFEPKPCYQCQDPKCVRACPIPGAMYIDADTYARVVDQTKCTGCGKCSDACASYYTPARVHVDPVSKKAMKCDLCNGDPQCVKWCSNGALKYVPLAQLRDHGYEQNFTEPYSKDRGPACWSSNVSQETFQAVYPNKKL